MIYKKLAKKLINCCTFAPIFNYNLYKSVYGQNTDGGPQIPISKNKE